jgi:hypothetical protein
MGSLVLTKSTLRALKVGRVGRTPQSPDDAHTMLVMSQARRPLWSPSGRERPSETVSSGSAPCGRERAGEQS